MTERLYVRNKDLLGALVEYRKTLKTWNGEGEKPRVPEFIGQCIYLICARLGRRSNFARYTWNEDMVGDAIESCVLAVPNFDPAKSSNPFGYFSRVAWRAMVHRIETEHKQTFVKICNYENLHVVDRVSEGGEPARVGNQFTDEFVRNFEEKMQRRRAKRRPKSARRTKKKT